MAPEESAVLDYPYIRNLALTNGHCHGPVQFCVSRCVCCGKVNVVVIRVQNGRIVERLAERWQELSQAQAPNLGGVFCPDCRPPGEDWDIVRPDGSVATTIHRPGREVAQAYLDQYKIQYQNCTIRPRAPTP